MTEQVVNFVLKNWGLIVWTVSTLGTVAGLIIYNAKVILPGFVKRMDDMEKDITDLKDKNDEHKDFMTESECRKNHKAFDTANKAEHAAIQTQVDKILKCVETSESMRQRAKVHQISFMTAVKEKLDLKFEVPQI